MPLNHLNSHSLPCGCAFHVIFDDTLPPEQIVSEFFALENVCDDHRKYLSQAEIEPDDFTQQAESKFAALESILDDHHARLLAEKHNERAQRLARASQKTPGRIRTLLERKLAAEKQSLELSLRQRKDEVLMRYAEVLSMPHLLGASVYRAVQKEQAEIAAAALAAGTAAAATTTDG